jgi:sRNA-binding protein
MATQTFTDVLSINECGGCGVTWGITRSYEAERRKDHKTFYCPNGCWRYFPQKNTEERLRAELARTEGALVEERQRAEHAKRQLAAAKGRITRMRKRAAAGVCPCCNRQFTQVLRHMRAKHPDEMAEMTATV